jgi:hypothetical protein
MVENLEQLNCKTDKKRGNTTLIATSGIITWEKFTDTKGTIRRRQSKKNKNCNGQKTRTRGLVNNDLQNTTPKTKDCGTQGFENIRSRINILSM